MLEFEVPPPQQQFFEGAEKLLEVWFTNTDGPSDNGDLRKIPRLVGTHFTPGRYLRGPLGPLDLP